MKGFLERLQWKLSGMMQGRRGADTFSNFLVVAGIVLLFASLIPGLDLLSWVALIVLAYSLFRSYSKNIAARDRENAIAQPTETRSNARREGRPADPSSSRMVRASLGNAGTQAGFNTLTANTYARYRPVRTKPGLKAPR